MNVYWPRVVGIFLSFFFLAYVIHLVRRKKLREEYSVFWVILALLIFALSLSKGLLVQVSRLLHFPMPILTIFFFGMFLILCICLYFSFKLSELQRKVNILAQEMALDRPIEPTVDEKDDER